jgi:catechol 2,3-dioxygenase
MGSQLPRAPRPAKGPPDPEEMDAAAAVPSHGALAPTTTVGAVHLTVADLDRSTDYYRKAIGLEILERTAARLSLGAGGRELLVLIEQRGARPVPGSTGLYHFALLVPRRGDLARWLAHAGRDRVPVDGLSDHFVSEALYLTDPDGHGIELYWDRPREIWEGKVASRLTTIPLDVEDLLSELGTDSEPFELLPDGTVMGHVHFKLAEIPGTLEFYRDTIGFGLMAQLGRHAAFFAAGGYHHHLGANNWESTGGGPAPAGAAALRHAVLVLPDAAERERVVQRLQRKGIGTSAETQGPMVRDPSGNALVLAIASDAVARA